MIWLKSSSKKPPQELYVPQVLFLCEQDGPPERAFKDQVVDFFKETKSVRTAYLARVTYGSGKNAGVAICVRAIVKSDEALVEGIGRIFASIFGDHEQLDIVFLTSEQEHDLLTVCRPFFTELT